MLKIKSVRTPHEKQILFAAEQAGQQTWVVSDLQSKSSLQKKVLELNPLASDQAILRASELWRRLAFQLFPAVRVVSSELAQTLFWTWVEPLNLPWARTPQSISVLLQHMSLWMGVFAQDDHNEIMAEWFQANPEAYVRFGHWYELSENIWQRSREDSLVVGNWLPSLILNSDTSRLKWTRPLVFDLGPQVTAVEVQLIHALSKTLDVEIVYPQVPWLSQMSGALQAYESLPALPKSQAEKSWQPRPAPHFSFSRFSTQLSEVKEAVAQIRQWLDAGIPLSEIVLLAPDMEAYWPVLNLFLEQEGIPAEKPVTAPLIEFAEMAQWLAKIRVKLGQVSSENLERFLFSAESDLRMSVDDFRVLFTNVFDAGDLQRAEAVFLNEDPLPQGALGLVDFLSWSLKSWPRAKKQLRLEKFLQILGQEVPPGTRMGLPSWLSYMEGLLTRREIEIESGRENSLSCLSLSSANWVQARYGILIGLNETSLRHLQVSPMSSAEVQKLQNDTGFILAVVDRQELEFELLWLMEKHWSEFKLYCADHDFEGSATAPSRFWMWAGMQNQVDLKNIRAPQLTRWDEIQNSEFAAIAGLREWSESHREGLKFALARDWENKTANWGKIQQFSLSASSLNQYWSCPFQFAASRLFKLKDEPVLDLDLDRRTRGQLLHALLEKMTEEPWRSQWQEAELRDLINRVRVELGIKMGDERIWPAIEAQHLDLLKRFIGFETEWRSQHPNVKVLAREVDFSLVPEALGSDLKFEDLDVKINGRIDRVDEDGMGRLAVIDYKASRAKTTGWASWLNNDDIQMPLYVWALESGATGLPAGAVVMAKYLVVRNSQRLGGFELIDDEPDFYSLEEKSRQRIELEQKQAMLTDWRARLREAVQSISLGELRPNPKKPTICEPCHWRTLCRAPHLN